MIKLTEELIRTVSDKAKASPRKRTNYNFHKNYDDVVQRLLNAAEPGTYIQPHKHENPDKNEVFIILNGSVVVVEFDDNGNVIDHAVLDPAHGVRAVEIPPGKWHTFITLKPGSVLYEVKDGPYDEKADKHFAPWAPAEGAPDAQEFNKKILEKLDLNE
ncbi:MAG: WbuC family cupin fold metalloprotein [Candidatus Omnitrophica bacterium]|nr:WbuC family cupin fold metalloprotein [Candidatus Omnitrophota bacterium]